MNLTTVMDELGAALGSISGLRVFPYDANKVTPPAAIVDLPEPIEFDETYHRGMDHWTVPVSVVVGGTGLPARDALGPYISGSGVRSIKAVVDGYTYTSCDSVTVVRAEIAYLTFGGAQFLGALFDVDVAGQGA